MTNFSSLEKSLQGRLKSHLGGNSNIPGRLMLSKPEKNATNFSLAGDGGIGVLCLPYRAFTGGQVQDSKHDTASTRLGISKAFKGLCERWKL